MNLFGLKCRNKLRIASCQDRQCTCNVKWRSVRVGGVVVEKKGVLIITLVFVSIPLLSGMIIASFLHRILLSSVACPALWYYSTLSHKWRHHHHHHHHHHHVPEGLGVFPVLWSSRWSWSLPSLPRSSLFLRPFGLYCSACFGSLLVSILCTCCGHFFWYCFISFTMFCAPVFV